MTDHLKIVDRIRKLLALASNNSSEHEREAALGKAHAMLLEHNLSMSDVAGDDRVDMDVDQMTEGFNHAKPWSRYICNAIAELYFCKFVWSRTHDQKMKITFVGTRVDAQVAHAVCQHVLNSVWTEALAFARGNKGRGHTHSRMMTDFVNNASASIYWRCKKMVDDAKKGATGESAGRALMVVGLYEKKLDAAQAFIEGKIKLAEPKKVRPMMLNASGAAAAGSKHGESVRLTMELGN